MSTSPALRQLGRYELLRRVAAGGMGEIFLARMRGAAGFEKRVIIKTILPHLAEEEEFIEKFLDEGRIVVQLTHGNIVPVFDMGEENGEFFIAMEYIPGRDLRELIKIKQLQGEQIALPIALHIVSEVCKGLGYAHRKVDEQGAPLELVHRDVSPSNVLISNEGEVKLIDFGIARATTKISRTVSGRIQGKFCYMSPEQASGRIVDARSDIFSVGVMLYEMLTGLRPFEGATDLETLDLVRHCEYDPASTIDPRIPEEVDAILARALCKELDDRYASIELMQADILQFLYASGCAPSTREIVQYLSETFSGEIERLELRAGTPSRQSVNARDRPRRLDDILDEEIARLGMGLEQTMPSAPELVRAEGTYTEAPSPLPTPRQRPPHTATLVADPTPQPIEAEEDSGPEFTSEPSPPLDDTPLEEAPGDAALTPAELTPTPSREIVAPAVTAPLPAASPAANRRPLLVAALLLVVLIGAAIAWQRSQRDGVVLIDSDPQGASLSVDGARHHGVLTPARIELEPGIHDLLLEHPDYQPYKLRVQVLPNKEISLAAETMRLEPRPSTQEVIVAPPRTLRVDTRPSGATLLVEGREIGPAPQQIELPADRPIIVYAQREGCEDADVTLSHRYARDSYVIPMLCKEDELPSIASPPESTPNEDRTPKTRKLPVAIRAQPRDAVITVNDASPREGVFTGQVLADKPLKIKVYKRGYRTFERSVMPASLRNGTLEVTLEAEPRKCVDIRLMAIQVADEVFIDDTSIGPVRASRRGVEVTAGRHTLRAVNRVAGRDERIEFEVAEDATSCANVVVFPRER